MFLYCAVYLLGWKLSVKNKDLLNLVIRSANKTFGITLPTIDDLYESYVTKKTAGIIKDLSHPLRAF